MSKRSQIKSSTAEVGAQKRKKLDRSGIADDKGWRAVQEGVFDGLEDEGFMGLEELDAPKIFSSSTKAALKEHILDKPRIATSQGGEAGQVIEMVNKSKPDSLDDAGNLGHKAQRLNRHSAGSVVVSAAAEQLKDGARRYQERILAQRATRNEKLAAAKAKIGAANFALEKSQLPEGLSRSQQKKLLMDLKRARRKAALKHKKAKLAERRSSYKQRKALRDSVKEADAPAEENEAEQPKEEPNMAAWEVFELHPAIVTALAAKGFVQPTPIQEACLQPAILGRRDIIGAAQTGSGKTLAFGLPILQRLLASGCGHPGLPDRSSLPMSDLRCLVLLPTRELAMQVEQHLQAIARFCGIRTASIVGGLSALKQERILSKRPAVVTATPGRLWDLMSGGGGVGGGSSRGGSTGGVASKHLTNVSALDFLVIDEADRMVQQGHFEELGNIVAYIMANRGGALDGSISPVSRQDPSEAKPGPGPGLFDNERPSTAATSNGGASDSDNSKDTAEETFALQSADGTDHGAPPGGSQTGQKDRTISAAAQKSQHLVRPSLQVFVFSATLTLPQSLRKRLRRGGGGAGGGSSNLEALMDHVPFGPRPKVVDLTSSSNRLASKLQEAYLKCNERHRDELLYYLLVKHPGRTLVFVNAVSATRRLAALLQHLGLPAIALHANQQQRQRLKALDRFKAQPNGVLVATDVAARGLDVHDIRCVVHYQLPASADLYVHRSGRTARAASDGVSVALVTPSEARRWDALQAALDRPALPEFPVDEHVLPACKARVALAVRLDSLARSSSKAQADKSWMAAAAADLGLELKDDEVASDGEVTRPRKQRELLRRMKKAGRRTGNLQEESSVRQELAALLAEPLRGGFSQKYFTGGAAGAAAMLPAAGDTSEPNAGDGMDRVVQLATAVSDSRSAASADIEAKLAAAAKRTKRDKAQHAMLVHSERLLVPGSAEPASEAHRTGEARSPERDGLAVSEPGQHATIDGDEGHRAKLKQRTLKLKGATPGGREGHKTRKSSSMGVKRKRKPVETLPTALGRDIQGEDALAVLQRQKSSKLKPAGQT